MKQESTTAKYWYTLMDMDILLFMSVFLNDLDNLVEREVFDSLCKNFTINKTTKQFSSIGIDQAHEQNNKIVKTDGGAIGIVENEQALLD